MIRTRKKLASDSSSIEVPGVEIPLHMYQTFDLASALDEKLAECASVLACYADWDFLKGVHATRAQAAGEGSERHVGGSSEMRRSKQVRSHIRKCSLADLH